MQRGCMIVIILYGDDFEATKPMEGLLIALADIAFEWEPSAVVINDDIEFIYVEIY